LRGLGRIARAFRSEGGLSQGLETFPRLRIRIRQLRLDLVKRQKLPATVENLY
jgi:hypothetical protein